MAMFRAEYLCRLAQPFLAVRFSAEYVAAGNAAVCRGSDSGVESRRRQQPAFSFQSPSAARPRAHARGLPWCNSARPHEPSGSRRVRRESAGREADATAPPSAGQPCTLPTKRLPERGGRDRYLKRRAAALHRSECGACVPYPEFNMTSTTEGMKHDIRVRARPLLRLFAGERLMD